MVSDAWGYFMAITYHPEQSLVFWSALTRLTQVWAPFFNPIYLVFSIVGVVFLEGNLSPWRRRLVLSWLFISSIAAVLVSPLTYGSGQESQIWRVFYLTPFQFTAPIGLFSITRIMGAKDYADFPISGALVAGAAGVILAFAGSWWLRGVLLLILIPLWVVLKRPDSHEVAKVVVLLVVVLFVVISFNSTLRALSQLLLDPHNCSQC